MDDGTDQRYKVKGRIAAIAVVDALAVGTSAPRVATMEIATTAIATTTVGTTAATR